MNVNYIQLIDGALLFSYVLTDIFCLLGLSVADRRVSKSLAIIVDLSVSLCSSISFCLMYFDTLHRCMHFKDCLNIGLLVELNF